MSDSYNPQPLPPLDPNLEIGQNHYWNYHHLEQLLSCKQPITASKDEDLFIAVHQICEIAFHQAIADLDRTLEALREAIASPDPMAGETGEACYFFDRVLRLYEVAATTMPILNTLRAFAEFRTSIGPTSGFQSFQFRRLEIMSGVRDPYWAGGTSDGAGNPHVAEVEFNRRYGKEIEAWFEQYRQHNLAFYYELLLGRAEGNSRDEKIATLLEHPRTQGILKRMRDYDELQTRFHQGHLGLATKQLKIVGVDVGTGGTSFRNYLAKYDRTVAPLFPGL
ncbi:MAG: tryptophan 2,3-dioxygenase family protein [Cyanobacteriota bacterium]|nr:tryptophan 2,3-dioxygenase family protein [Cyanobacteriota bacterium]